LTEETTGGLSSCSDKQRTYGTGGDGSDIHPLQSNTNISAILAKLASPGTKPSARSASASPRSESNPLLTLESAELILHP